MPALFDHEMALAAVDPWKLREDGSSNWSVHYFDRMGRWTASATGMTKSAAKEKAARARRRARAEKKVEAGKAMGRATQIEISISVRHRDANYNIVGSGASESVTFPIEKGEKYAQAIERGLLNLPVDSCPEVSSKMVRKRILEWFLRLVDEELGGK